MKQGKLRLKREEAFNLFPVAGYGTVRYSRGLLAKPVGGGWWDVKLSPLWKGAPFLRERKKLEV